MLVGSHVIDDIGKFIFDPSSYCVQGKKFEAIEDTKDNKELSNIPQNNNVPTNNSDAQRTASDVVIVLEDEKTPLVNKYHSYVTVDAVCFSCFITLAIFKASLITLQSSAVLKYDTKKKVEKSASKNNKKKRSSAKSEDDEAETEGLDWWSKYHASKQAAANQLEDETSKTFTHSNSTNIAKLSNNARATDSSNKKSESEAAKKSKFTTSSFVSKLSPKSQRKREQEESNVAQLKVALLQ